MKPASKAGADTSARQRAATGLERPSALRLYPIRARSPALRFSAGKCRRLLPRPRPRASSVTGDQDDHRTIEIAMVHLDPTGHGHQPSGHLVNAGRAPGPSPRPPRRGPDRGAPRFAEVTDWVSDLLADRIAVAHNADFDLTFLTVDCERADVGVPLWPSLCTIGPEREDPRVQRWEPAGPLRRRWRRIGQGHAPRWAMLRPWATCSPAA